MNKLAVYNTNKILLQVTLLAPFYELRNSCFPALSSQTLEQFSSYKGYYLNDSISGFGDQEKLREIALSKISSKIFSQELSEIGIPTENWPDIENFYLFKEYIKVDYLCLIADFGENKIENKISYL